MPLETNNLPEALQDLVPNTLETSLDVIPSTIDDWSQKAGQKISALLKSAEEEFVEESKPKVLKINGESDLKENINHLHQWFTEMFPQYNNDIERESVEGTIYTFVTDYHIPIQFEKKEDSLFLSSPNMIIKFSVDVDDTISNKIHNYLLALGYANL